MGLFLFQKFQKTVCYLSKTFRIAAGIIISCPMVHSGLKYLLERKYSGFQGDTKVDETINRIFNRDELLQKWFSSCDLVFHGIIFDNPGSVHTHRKQVQKLQQAILGQVFLEYHRSYPTNAPFPLVQEGKSYYL